MNKLKNKYGTFVTKQAWYFRRRHLTIASITVAVLILGVTIGFSLLRQNSELKLSIPAAQASEIPSWWYEQYFGAGVCVRDNCKPEADPDRDKLTNAQEFYYHTEPFNPDTNNNGLTDGEDVANNFDPSRPGKMTFEEVMHEDNIFGESLLLAEDVKDIIQESSDINKVNVPLVPEELLKITDEQTPEIYETYGSDLRSTINRYFAEEDLESLVAILEHGSSSEFSEIKYKAGKLVIDLKKITIPREMLNLHRQIIAFYQLLPEVLLAKDSSMDMASKESDVWFENVEALLAASQKINQEYQRLGLK
ncbi:MAG: hypothetical protein HYV13_03365 [Candidatus Doudnabacteria bacterium]|nr:hypothetical protein [Candidatus Doudnabacteria bacterium]